MICKTPKNGVLDTRVCCVAHNSANNDRRYFRDVIKWFKHTVKITWFIIIILRNKNMIVS